MEGGCVEAITHRKDVSVVLAEGTAGGRGEARNIISAVAGEYPDLELIAHGTTSLLSSYLLASSFALDVPLVVDADVLLFTTALTLVAALVSTAFRVPCATCDRTNTAWSASSISRSAMKRAVPVNSPGSSERNTE